MKDPYLEDYDAYLNSLDRFAAPRRKNPQATDASKWSHSSRWIVAAICAFVAVGAVAPLFG
jgi:hypothetical protein